MLRRSAILAALVAVCVACLSLLALPANANPSTITLSDALYDTSSQTWRFNGIIIATAPAGSQWDYRVTKVYYGNLKTGTVTADANGQVIVDVRYSSGLGFAHGYDYRVQIAPAGTTSWKVDQTLEADFNLKTFSVVSAPSGTVTSPTIPFTINTDYTGYVVISYDTGGSTMTSPHIPVTQTGTQTLQWDPQTPSGTTTYHISQIEMWSNDDFYIYAMEWEYPNTTVTHQPFTLNIAASSGPVATEDMAFTINAPGAGSVVLTYETLIPGSPPVSLGDTFTTQPIPVSGAGSQVLSWRPGTPVGASVLYHVKSVAFYDPQNNLVGVDAGGFTFTHEPMAEYTLTFSGPDVLPGGVITNDMQAHSVTITLKHGNTPVSGVAIYQDTHITPFGTTDANGQVTGTVNATINPMWSHFYATVNGAQPGAYLAFPLYGGSVVDLTVVDYDGSTMLGTAYAYPQGGAGGNTLGPGNPPLVLSAGHTELYVEGIGKGHPTLLRTDLGYSNQIRRSMVLNPLDPQLDLQHITVKSPLPTNSYALNLNGTPWQHTFQVSHSKPGATAASPDVADIVLPSGTWDLIDAGSDASSQNYILMTTTDTYSLGDYVFSSLTLDANPANLAAVQARTVGPGYVDYAGGTLQVGVTPSGAVSNVPIGNAFSTTLVTPGRYGVFRASLQDQIYLPYVLARAEFIPNWVTNGVAGLAADSSYTVDASGMGNLTVETWGRTSDPFQAVAGGEFHGRLVYESATGKFYPMLNMVGFAITVTGPGNIHPDVDMFNGWFRFSTPTAGSYTVSVTHPVAPFFRAGTTSTTATVNVSSPTLTVDGAFDGRGIGRSYTLTGHLAGGAAANIVQYTVGSGSNAQTGSAAVDPGGSFKISGNLPSVVAGEWVPVTVQIPGDLGPGVSFMAIVNLDQPDALPNTISPGTPQLVIGVGGTLTESIPFNLKGIHLEYTADTASQTQRWTVGRVLDAKMLMGQGVWGSEIRASEMLTTGWLLPQDGPTQYEIRYAAEDWAGNLGPWQYRIVNVRPVTVTVSVGGQANAPVHASEFAYVTVNVKVDGADQPSYWVKLGNQSGTTDANGNVVFPVFDVKSEVLPVSVYSSAVATSNPLDLVYTTGVFVLERFEAGVIFAAKDSNGPLTDLNIGYRHAWGAKGRLWAQDKAYAIVPLGTLRTSISAPAPMLMRYALFQEDTLQPFSVNHITLDAGTGTVSLVQSWSAGTVQNPVSGLLVELVPDDPTREFEGAQVGAGDVVLVKASTNYFNATYYGVDRNLNPWAAVRLLNPNWTTGIGLQGLVKVINDATDQSGNSGLDMDLNLTYVPTAGHPPYRMRVHIPAGGYAMIDARSWNYDYELSRVVAGSTASGSFTTDRYYFHSTDTTSNLQGATQSLQAGGPLTVSFGLASSTIAAGTPAEVTLGAQNNKTHPDVLVAAVEEVFVNGLPSSTKPLGVRIKNPSASWTITTADMPIGVGQPLDLPVWMADGTTYTVSATFYLGTYTDGVLTATQPVTVTGSGFGVQPRVVLTPSAQATAATVAPDGPFFVELVYRPSHAGDSLGTTFSGTVSVNSSDFALLSAIGTMPGITVSSTGNTVTISGDTTLYDGFLLARLSLQAARPGPLTFQVGPADFTFTSWVTNRTMPYDSLQSTVTALDTFVTGNTAFPVAITGPGATPGAVLQTVGVSPYQLENPAAGAVDLVAARAGYLGKTLTTTVTPGQTVTQDFAPLEYGDLDADGQVTAADLQILADNLHKPLPALPVVPAASHTTTLSDLIKAAQNYGKAESSTSLAANYGALTVAVSYAGALGDSPLNPQVGLYLPGGPGQPPGLRIPVAAVPVTATNGSWYTFNLPKVPAGTYEVEFATPGYAPDRQTVTIPAGGSASVTLHTQVALTARVIGAVSQGDYGVMVAGGSITTEVISTPWYDYKGDAYSDVGGPYSISHAEYSWDGADTETFTVSTLTPGATYYFGVQNRSAGKVASGTLVEVTAGRTTAILTVGNTQAHENEWLAFIVTVDANGVVTITPDGKPHQFDKHPYLPS